MIRKIITINEAKCNGCGLCVNACHEGAIGLVEGKAKLLHEHYCDGLGDCLPACPMDAISFEMREAPAYDAQAVQKAQEEKSRPAGEVPSRLNQWPCQIKLLPTQAPFFDGAKLLIAATCTAYAYAKFHEDFIKGHVTLVGCPKLDSVNYADKLTELFSYNNIRSIKQNTIHIFFDEYLTFCQTIFVRTRIYIFLFIRQPILISKCIWVKCYFISTIIFFNMIKILNTNNIITNINII